MHDKLRLVVFLDEVRKELLSTDPDPDLAAGVDECISLLIMGVTVENYKETLNNAAIIKHWYDDNSVDEHVIAHGGSTCISECTLCHVEKAMEAIENVGKLAWL